MLTDDTERATYREIWRLNEIRNTNFVHMKQSTLDLSRQISDDYYIRLFKYRASINSLRR